MKLDFMRTAARSYMIVQEIAFAYEEFELQMLLNNHIPGLLELQVICTNGSFEYWYDVTGMQSMEVIFSVENTTPGLLARCLREICDVRLQMENYFLDANDLLYLPSMLYRDKANGKLMFCCIPGYRTEQANGLKSFMEMALKNADHSDAQAVQQMYAVYEQCTNPDVRMEDLLLLVSDIREKPEPVRPVQTHQEEHESSLDGAQNELRSGQPPAAAVDLSPEGPVSSQEDLLSAHGAKQKTHGERKGSAGGGRAAAKKLRIRTKRGMYTGRDRSADREEDDWLQEGFTQVPPAYTDAVYANPQAEATTLLHEPQAEAGCSLCYCGSGRQADLILDHFPYLIGKSRQQADGIIEADTVSRLHARIHQENGEYLLEDMDSTNGTRINGTLLPARTPAVLKINDRIRFASEEFALQVTYRPSACGIRQP